MSVVSGAIAERMKLWCFLAFSVLMTGIIYPFVGNWIWGGGSVFGLFSLSKLGFVDFAGSGAVHLSGAIAALTGAIMVGPRLKKFEKSGKINSFPGANLPLACLGALILWFGWFGFNGGSQLSISTIADARAVGGVFVNTNLAACAGLLAALLFTRINYGKTDLTMGLNGALGALVAITADPASPSPWFAVVLGIAAGLLVVYSVSFFEKLRIDDPVGAVSVHGVAGVLGLLAVPISNPEASFLVQFLGITTIIVWVGVLGLASWYVLNMFFGLRVSPEEEEHGCDACAHGIQAYPEFVD